MTEMQEVTGGSRIVFDITPDEAFELGYLLKRLANQDGRDAVTLVWDDRLGFLIDPGRDGHE